MTLTQGRTRPSAIRHLEAPPWLCGSQAGLVTPFLERGVLGLVLSSIFREAWDGNRQKLTLHFKDTYFLALPGLSCGTWDLLCHVGSFKLWHVGSSSLTRD